MTNRERYLKVGQERQALSSAIAGLPQQLTWAKGESRKLEDETISKELLGEDAADAKRGLEKKREDIRRWERELEDGKDRVRVMNRVLEDLRAKAVAEETEPAQRRFGKAAKALVQAIRAAGKAEADLAAVREDIRKQFDAVGAMNPISQWEPVILRDIARVELKVSFGDFIDRLKAAGYAVE